MKTITVYDFEYHDPTSNVWLPGPTPATKEAISAHGWRAVQRSGREVAAESVASNGIAFTKALLRE